MSAFTGEHYSDSELVRSRIRRRDEGLYDIEISVLRSERTSARGTFDQRLRACAEGGHAVYVASKQREAKRGAEQKPAPDTKKRVRSSS